MKLITLQFCTFNSVFGTLIPWFTQGPVGHVDAVGDGGTLWGAQHQAGLGGKPAGVQQRPADYGAACGMINRIRFSFEATDAQHDAFWDFIKAQEGKPYDTTAIVAFVAGRDWHNPDSWICSELVAAATEAANLFPKKFYVTANGITPNALALVASAFSDPERLPDYA